MQEAPVRFLGQEDPWRRTPVFLGFACGSAGDLGSIPGLRGYPGEGKGYPLQHSGLENSMDFIVHGVAKSLTRLSDFQFHFQCNPGQAGLCISVELTYSDFLIWPWFP